MSLSDEQRAELHHMIAVYDPATFLTEVATIYREIGERTVKEPLTAMHANSGRARIRLAMHIQDVVNRQCSNMSFEQAVKIAFNAETDRIGGINV